MKMLVTFRQQLLNAPLRAHSCRLGSTVVRDETVHAHDAYLYVQLLSNERTQLIELANDDEASRKVFRFPQVLDITDLRSRQFKMAATGTTLTCIQNVVKRSTKGLFIDSLTDVKSRMYVAVAHM